MTWVPGQPWTHPSITSLTGSELRARLIAADQQLTDDMAEFGDAAASGHEEALALITSDRDRVKTLRRAIVERGGIA